MSTLPSQISSLSVAEKYELLDALWEDIEAHSPVVTEGQLAELDRRMAKYEQDPSSAILWEKIKADIFKQ
jgi:putative addiction module component (TIGR02574 family)